MEQHLLDESAALVTVLRPCAIHGLGSRHPREWWFVKRILDRRPDHTSGVWGTSRFHPAGP